LLAFLLRLQGELPFFFRKSEPFVADVIVRLLSGSAATIKHVEDHDPAVLQALQDEIARLPLTSETLVGSPLFSLASSIKG
jgi:hypothetical protein